MGPVVDVISIGALSRNRFWQETSTVRPAHATTTLVRHEGKTILVDPSLPPEILTARLKERTGLGPEQIDMVFLTTFRPVHRRGIGLFEQADWLMYEVELDAMRSHLQGVAGRAQAESSEPDPLVEEELDLLARFKSAPDKLVRGVDIFPTEGVSPGACALLVIPSQVTIDERRPIVTVVIQILCREDVEDVAIGTCLVTAVDNDHTLDGVDLFLDPH